MSKYTYIKWFDEISKQDVSIVGGKGANLGELTHLNLPVPPGFCISSRAYEEFIEFAKLNEFVKSLMSTVDVEDVDSLFDASEAIQNRIIESEFFEQLEQEIISAYRKFSSNLGIINPRVAVRSSATAEDLPDASFAGQQETYLHISGEKELLVHIKKCFASLWTSRAIYYREKQKYNHFDVALSVVIQKMVNSEKSGVMFTANPISLNKNEMMINASYGLGEAVVSGMVTPDEYIIDKRTHEIISKNIASKNFMVVEKKDHVGTEKVNIEDYLGNEFVEKECLSKDEIRTLIERGIKVEKLYGSPQDTEWAFDKDTKEFYFLQSRPITTLKDEDEEETEILNVLCKGLGASPGIGRGRVKLIKDVSEINLIEEGDILVTQMTNPDMVPAMKKVCAIVTDEGGRTCHAAIVSRELQIPCIVGTKNASKILHAKDFVTVDATHGIVYYGNVLNEGTKKKETSNSITDELKTLLSPTTATKIYMNLGNPELIDKYKNLPIDGIGLMRTEFIFTNMIGAHPMYLIKNGQENFMINQLAKGISKVAQAIYPKNCVVRMSDFRTNEFRNLMGGDEVEPLESNPMIGWRGVSRYISSEYEKGFRLECRAILKVRTEYGLNNVIAMLPFVRTVEELKKVKEIMASEGLVQSKNFKIWIMAEVPAVVLEAEKFAELVDGFSIGSNDLTQLIMGADRDSEVLSNMGYFDERNDAVKHALKILIDTCNKKGITCSICGQGPSQYPELAKFLVECGITSISVNPDTVEYTRRMISSVEKKIILDNIRNSLVNN